MRIKDAYPRMVTKPIAVLLGAGMLTGCGLGSSPAPAPGETAPTGAYVAVANGKTYLDMCFRTTDGRVVTIDMNAEPFRSFTGYTSLTEYPQLVQESMEGDGVATPFGSAQPIEPSALLKEIQTGELRPHVSNIVNAKVSLQCQESIDGAVPENYQNNLAVIDEWDGNNGLPTDLLAPIEGAYYDGTPYSTLGLDS